jgi:hypothetical protein
MDPTQSITGLYNFGIMNLLDILHFGCGTNVELCVKQLVTHIHGGIMWMDRMVQIDVALISKIIGLSTFSARPEEYLDKKVHYKVIT